MPTEADYDIKIHPSLVTPFTGELGKRAVIYYLVDPRTDEIRYVGKTEQSLKTRVSAHMRDTYPCHRVHWLNELKADGVRPVAVPLVAIEGIGWPWQLEERWWIRRLQEMGARLVNNTIGGDGVSGLPAETRARMSKVWLGRKHKPETIAKLKAARANMGPHSAETKAKMSASQKGRKITWIGKIAESLRKLSPAEAAFVKLRLEAGERGCDLAKEFHMHRTSISKIKMGTYFGRKEAL